MMPRLFQASAKSSMSAQRALDSYQCFSGTLQCLEDKGAVVQRVGKIGRHRQCLVIAGQRLIGNASDR